MTSTLSRFFAQAAADWPMAEVVFPDERTTYADLQQQAEAMTRLLWAAGARPGDKVGILLAPAPSFIATLLGIAGLGATIVPLNERLKAHELRYLIAHADMTVLVTTARGSGVLDLVGAVGGALPDLHRRADGTASSTHAPMLRRVLLLDADEAPDGFTAAGQLSAIETPDPSDLVALVGAEANRFAYIMYTSGTSANPKGCLITHDAVLQQGRALADTRYFLTEQDTFWCPLPLFHNGGLATMMACLSSGATFVHAGRFDPDVAVRQLEEEGCTHALPTFEPIWMPILTHPRFSQIDLRRLRITLTAGSAERLRFFQEQLPHAVQLANFGMTEGTGHVTMTLPSDPLEVRVTTGGHPLPGMEVRVVDSDGKDLAAGEQGEILFRGPTRFAGYYKDEAATAAAIDSGGWFHTGDLGMMDPEGRLTFTGRLKDMLKVGGENVAATEVEAYLLRHPAVLAASVVAVPDGRYGEVPAAFVELVTGKATTQEELIAFCLGQIATFKVPRYVRFVEEWPMSGTKVKKYLLRQRIAEELDAAGITEAPVLRSNVAVADAEAGT